MALKLSLCILVIALFINDFVHSVPVDKDGSVEVTTKRPGWARRSWNKVKGYASRVKEQIQNYSYGKAVVDGNAAAEKICDLVKRMVPIMEAICKVGQFSFCAPVTELSSGKSNPDVKLFDVETFNDNEIPANFVKQQ